MAAGRRSDSARAERLSEKKLTSLYREYYPKVYNHIYYRVLSRELTEDLVSEVFIRVVRSYQKFDPTKSAFSTWIFRITHNILIDHYRSSKPSVPLDDILGSEPSSEDSYEGLDEHEKEVRRLLEYLDDEERELVFLRFHEEKKVSEIADLLGMNPSTVSTKLSRALAKMRAHTEDSLHG